jgi:ribonuclease HII
MTATVEEQRKEKIYVAGIDEAGRGPVIGPMVICIAIIEKDKEEGLHRIGVKDSKMLSPKQREELAGVIKDQCKIYLTKLTARQLNEQMKKKSLNQIEADAISELIKNIPEKIMERIDKIYIDVPDPIPVKFVYRLNLPKYIYGKIHASHKADVKYPICSAASIIAKTVRDDEIEKIKHELQCEFGTGYSHDVNTISCLEKNIGDKRWQKYLRMEWSTAKRLLQKSKFKTKQVKLEL